MQSKREQIRNRPAEEGRNHDPELRDDSAAQPGVQTMSSSKTDADDQNLTETAKDGFRENARDEKADATMDETNEQHNAEK